MSQHMINVTFSIGLPHARLDKSYAIPAVPRVDEMVSIGECGNALGAFDAAFVTEVRHYLEQAEIDVLLTAGIEPEETDVIEIAGIIKRLEIHGWQVTYKSEELIKALAFQSN